MYLSQTYKILYESRLDSLSAKLTLIIKKHAKWKLLPFNKNCLYLASSVTVRIF